MLVSVLMNIEHQQRDVLARLRMLYQILVKSLANFAFKSSPDVGIHIRRLFLVLFCLQPLPNALQMNVFYGAGALAWIDDWVPNRIILRRQANPALNFLIFIILATHVRCIQCLSVLFLNERQICASIGSWPCGKSVEVMKLALILLSHVYCLNVSSNALKACGT